jgi:hypothetical protein
MTFATGRRKARDHCERNHGQRLIQCFAYGHSDVCPGNDRIAPGGTGRLSHPGAAGHESRSAGDAEI